MATEPAPPAHLEEVRFESTLLTERMVLGALLIGPPDQIARVKAMLPPEAFHRVAHRKIYEAILALHEKGDPPDLALLCGELERRDELKLVDGPSFVASLYENFAGAGNAEPRAQLVLQHWARRRTRRAANRLLEVTENGSYDLNQEVEAARVELVTALEVHTPHRAAEKLLLQSRTHDELMAAELPKIDPVIGTGLIVRGELAVLASMPGLGKTYLALQMMRAVALGEQFLGYGAVHGNAGLLELEMSPVAIRDRAQAGLERSLGDRAHYLVMPEGFRYVTESGTVDALCRWVDQKQLTLMAMDPLYLLHDGDENDAQDVGRFLDACRLICRRTGVALVILHHVNKMEMDEKAGLRTSVMRSVKGSGRLVSDPATVLGVIERHGARELVFAKTRLCASPVSIGIRADSHGYFTVTDTSEQVADHNTEKIEKCLLFYGDAGASLTDLKAKTGLARATIYRHLTAMDVVTLTDGRTRRYFARENAPPAQDDLPEF